MKHSTWLILGFALVVLFLSYLGSRGTAARQHQLQKLLAIENDVMEHGARLPRVVERIKGEVSKRVTLGRSSRKYKLSSSSDRGRVEICQLEPILNPLGFGGGWIVHIEIDANDSVVSLWYSWQPVGWP